MADWLSAAATVGSAVASLIGNSMGASAENKGLKKAQKEAEAMRVAAANRGIAYLQPDIDAGAGGTDALMAMMTAHPEILSPSQQRNLQLLTQRGRANLSAGGLRGAGRAGQAVLDDAEEGFLADSFDANRGRSDRAAEILAGRGSQARTGAANITSGVGSANAGDIMSTGEQIASNDGNLFTAGANTIGSTLGALSSFARRDRPYSKYPASLNVHP